MRSDHLAKHVKTHNAASPGNNNNPTKKGSSESCSDSEEQNPNDMQQNSPNNHSLAPPGSLDASHSIQQHNTMILTPHQINAHQHIHHHHTPHNHHTPSPGLEHVSQLDVKPGIV